MSSMFWENRAIQAVPSACSRKPPVGKGALRSKTPMLSRPRKPPSNRFLPSRSLRLSHQLKLKSSFWKMRLRNGMASGPSGLAVEAVVEQGRPGVHRRVDVAEVPFVRRKLAVGMLVAVAQHQIQLTGGEVRIDDGQGRRVEGQVPGGEPRVLPLVGHRDDVRVVHVEPVPVADAVARRLGIDALGPQPLLDVVQVGLLAPQQAGVALAQHPRRRPRSVEGGSTRRRRRRPPSFAPRRVWSKSPPKGSARWPAPWVSGGAAG